MKDGVERAGHTAGTWMAAAKPSSVVGWPVVASPHGRVICTIGWRPKLPDDNEAAYAAAYAECEANARLIASAPDLLEALRLCRPYAAAAESRDMDNAALAALIAADAAIQKATSLGGGDE